MDFYTIVLIIAIILLIIILTVVGLMLTKVGNSDVFPTFKNPCPDGWSQIGDKCTCDATCYNKPKIYEINGSVSPSSTSYVNYYYTTGIDPILDISKSLTSLSIDISRNTLSNNWKTDCDKTLWAKANGIIWDGISNNNQC